MKSGSCMYNKIKLLKKEEKKKRAVWDLPLNSSDNPAQFWWNWAGLAVMIFRSKSHNFLQGFCKLSC
jgi:hypothetical protein